MSLSCVLWRLNRGNVGQTSHRLNVFRPNDVDHPRFEGLEVCVVLLKFCCLCLKAFYHYNEVHSRLTCKLQCTLDSIKQTENHWNSVVFMLIEGKYDKLDVTISKNRNVVLKKVSYAVFILW